MTDTETIPKRSGGSQLSLGQMAYDAVRNAIEQGNLTPGDRISEYKVAEWLHISRTPAREGLLRLESEGLLASHPRRGLVVASIDNEAIRELYAAREFLEGRIARLAAQNASRSEIDELLQLVEAEADVRIQAESRDDSAVFYEHNKVFHQQIYRAAHNRYLMKFLSAMNDIIVGEHRLSPFTDKKRRQGILREHRLIAEAIASRDADGAEQAAMAHMRAAFEARIKARKDTAPAKPNLPPLDLTRRRKKV